MTSPSALPPALNPDAARALLEAARMLRDARRVLITTHTNPDGDAVGSTLALAHALRDRGATADVVLADSPPGYCAFLPGIDWIVANASSTHPDIAVVCDAAGLDRIGPVEKAVRSARQIVEIDHHSIARPFGKIRVVDDHCFATAEIIYYLLSAMEAPLTPEIATNLMVGVVTDTGAFRFTNVNARTFTLAAKLMEAGADLHRIIDQVYDQKSLSSLRLLEKAISHLKVEKSFASTILYRKEFEEVGAGQTEAEGLISHLRSLGGVEVAAVLREVSPGEIRVSLRGRPGVNVAEIAALMGGGGHAAAAGCTIGLPLEDAERHLRRTVHAILERQRHSK